MLKHLRLTGNLPAEVQNFEFPDPLPEHIGYKGLDEFVGCDEVVGALKDFAQDFLEPHDLASQSVPLERGILLYGSGGVGKSSLVKALAKAVRAEYMPLSAADILHGNVGQPGLALRDAFATAADMDGAAIIFCDELDSIFGKGAGGNEGVNAALVGEAKVLLDDKDNFPNVIFAGATNHKTAIDPTLLRSGRFDLKIEVKKPDTTGRAQLFAHFLGQHATHFNLPLVPGAAVIDLAVNTSELAAMSEGLSGADIEGIINSLVRSHIRVARKINTQPICSYIIT